MTREVGDILIQEVLEHKEYTNRYKTKLINKIKKLVAETNWTYGGRK